jgi:hypothetical protein
MAKGFPDNDPRCYKRIPPHILASIDAWVLRATPTGGFVGAVLKNDLKGAVSHADLECIPAIPAMVAYLYNECPMACWGSVDQVKAWAAAKQGKLV